MENENPFKIGQVVQLKSGGAKMTIEDFIVDNETGKVYAVCVWQDKNKPYEEEYLINVLKAIDDTMFLPKIG